MSDAQLAALQATREATIVKAIKASGVVVKVEKEEFCRLLERTREPLVVMALGGIFKTHYEYLLSYRGLVFFTKSDEVLHLPEHSDVVQAGAIWIPD